MLQYTKGTDSSRDTLSSVGKFPSLCSGYWHGFAFWWLQVTKEINKVDNFDTQLSNSVQSSYEQCTGILPADSMLGCTHLKSELLVDNALLIAKLEKEIDDYPEHACCSYKCLHQRKAVTWVKLSENLRSERELWSRLTSRTEPKCQLGTRSIHVQLLQPLIKKNILPPHC